MEDKHDSADTVWLMVRYWLAKIVEGMGGSLSSKAKLILDDLQIHTESEKIKGCQNIVWHKPPAGWLKLNVDGSCRNNSRSYEGGETIRDASGNYKAGFSNKFENDTNNGAKLWTLKSGVRQCKSMDYQSIQIETNS